MLARPHGRSLSRPAPPHHTPTVDTDSDGIPATGFDDPELIRPRADEQLPLVRLEPWLREHLEGAEGPLSLAQFRGGRANLTYILRFGEESGAREFVLRRPPLGPIPPGSHDMAREHRVLSRLWRVFPLAPRCYLHCDDTTLIGAPFQVMERRRGQIIRREMPAPYATDGVALTGIADMLVDALVALHSVDRSAAGLTDLGHPQGFVQRQVEGWAKRWYAAAHGANPDMDRLVAWLRDSCPASDHVVLLHNDYKLDNVLLDAVDPTRAVAILDWDMCTSGDPLMDLGYLLNQWVEPTDPPDWIAMTSLPSHTPGFPGRDHAVARYAAATGVDVSRVRWYHAFAAMKFAAVVQQIFIRFHRGQTRDTRFAAYDERARAYIAKGLAVAGIG
jgi:aminoglycoside phosphotransferase (APT) family kinase protein